MRNKLLNISKVVLIIRDEKLDIIIRRITFNEKPDFELR